MISIFGELRYANNTPSFCAKQGLDPFLLSVWVLLLEIIRKAECYDRKTRFVRLYVYQRICSTSQDEANLNLLIRTSGTVLVTVDIAQYGEEACSFKGT